MKTTIFKTIFFALSFSFSILLTIGDQQSIANEFADANATALSDDLGIGNPLCRGQLFKNCSSSQSTCSFHISPTVVCTIENFKPGINPN